MPSEKPGPIYLLPGMTPGYPVFGKLAPLLPRSTIVNYDAPSLRESIAAYAARIAGSFQDESYVVGVSFGGIIAQEICRVLEPRGCIVISSIKNHVNCHLGSESCGCLVVATANERSEWPVQLHYLFRRIFAVAVRCV